MSILLRWLNGALEFWRDKQDENLRWHLARHQNIAALRRSRALSERALLAELKKQAQRLEYELALVETKNRNELAMVKIQCKQELKDYRQYLQALDKLKQALRENYSHLPEAVAFTIHQHAKQLLNRMWDEREPQEKLKDEMQLIRFMTAVHEDSLAAKSEGDAMPQKTLAIIDGGKREML